ncbi:hypothetical protein PHLCEN_2v7999 [Hermanssonia centrifuga]|uniref:Uncharacterized protein n=1 Tax=Hermanssonia centrifuga TaxID=98765 RepID=A0A2R6NVI9_9APHY|nr:hypothetical protein PHLCEN_2v7999 [Hermanssonia centrifuga]
MQPPVILQHHTPTLQLPPLRIARLRAYKAWLPQFIQENLEDVPPSFQKWKELSELELTDTMRNRMAHHLHLQTTQPNLPNSAPTTVLSQQAGQTRKLVAPVHF